MIRWFLGSRLRLVSASVILAVLLLGVGPAATAWIWEESASHSANLFILLGLSFVVLGFGAALASLLCDLIFPNRWRERVLLGRRIDLAPEALDSDDPLRGAKTFMVPYSLLIVGLVATSGWALDRTSGGFLERYQRFGGVRTTLRSEDVAGKLEALKDLGDEKRENRITANLDLLDLTWRDPRQPPEVQRAALGAMASNIRYLSDAIDSWAYEGRQSSWQHDLFGRLRKELAPTLREARGGLTAGERSADLVTLLGLLRDEPSQTELIAVAQGPEDSPLWHASVVALGRMRTFAALEALLPVAERPLTGERWEVVAWATQALAREYHKGRPDLDERRLSEAEEAGLARAAALWTGQLADGKKACVAAAVALHFRDSRFRDPLIAAFDAPGANAVLCETWSIDIGFGRRDYAAERGFLQRRIIDALALISLGDAVVKQWVITRQRDMSGLDGTVRALLADFNRYL